MPKRITLDLKDADIHNVVRLLADVGKINIVIPDDIKARVTVKLRDVPWTEALDVILRSKGLGREQVGSVVQVDTLERIVRRQQMNAELNAAREETEELVTVIIPVSYTSAASLKPLVQGMLSKRGKVEVDPRTNSLIITDVRTSTEKVRSVTESP